jgi:hypothetical protein
MQAFMLQISESNSQKDYIIETFEVWCVISKQAFSAPKEWEREHSTRVPAPWTDSRPHPRIVNQLVEGNEHYVNL